MEAGSQQSEISRNDAERNLERLVRLQGSDPGFFVLAVHSFVEGWLTRRYRSEFDGYELEFADLLMRFRDDLRDKTTYNGTDLTILGLLARNHSSTNGVRHRFEALTAEDARAATHHAIRFCALAGIDGSTLLKRLEEALVAWNERRCTAELLQDLVEARRRLTLTADGSASMTKAVSELQSVKEQLSHAQKHRDRLEHQIAELQSSKEHKDAQVDDLRRRLHEQETEERQLRERISKLEPAETYLNALLRTTVYTRTRFDYERVVSRLSKEQESVLGQIDLNKDFLVRGTAGTGKTLVLIEALKKALGIGPQGVLALDHEAPTAMLLTFTHSLVKYDRYIAKLTGGDSNRIVVSTIDAFLREKLLLLGAPPGWEAGIATELARKALGPGPFAETVAFEAEDFIWANDISRSEYLEEMIERRGMGRPLTVEQRTKVWEAAERIAGEMESRRRYSKNFSRLKIVRYAQEHPGDERIQSLDHAFIDETQDLSAVELRALKACTRGSIIMAGDSGQSIYKPGFSFKRAGVDVQGRSRSLRNNFRNTIELHSLAERYRRKGRDADPADSGDAFRGGPPPELFMTPDAKDLLSLLLDRVRMFTKDLGYDPGNIGVIAPSNADLDSIGGLLEANGYKTGRVKSRDFDFTDDGTIRLATIHSCKGLEFPVVLLFLLSVFVPKNAYDESVNATVSHNLIYVAITRAMDHLNVFLREGAEAPAITELIECIEEKESSS